MTGPPRHPPAAERARHGPVLPTPGGADVAEQALRSPYHLACVSGPDIGAVVALGGDVILGRQGDLILSDPRISRCHARVNVACGARRAARDQGVALVHDLGSVNGTVVHRRGRPSRVIRRLRGPGDAVTVRCGDVIIIGRDHFELRSRPRDLSWPSPDPPRARGARMVLLPVAMTLALLVWRVAAVVQEAPLGVVISAAAVVGVAVVGLLTWQRRRSRHRWAQRDAAGLALIAAALDAGSRQASPLRRVGTSGRHHDSPGEPAVSVWPARAGPRGALALDLGGRTHPEKSVRSLGAIGPGARAAARWWCAQVAVRTGGATIHEGAAAPRILGDGHVTIHVVDGPRCPICAGPDQSSPSQDRATHGAYEPEQGQRAEHDPHADILHLGVAATYAEMPPWCERVLAAPIPPVSDLWWDQVARVNGQDAPGGGEDPPVVVRFEDRVRDQDPPTGPADAASLCVVLGRDAHGPVTLDLVGDGPHALLAGTTGSGKSEALTAWMLALCERTPPSQLRLVLIDYKGGAAFAPLARLPHTEAILTDLDPAATDRAIRGLRALLEQRERELSSRGLPDLTRWQAAHDAGAAPVPPPRIVVAVDEFRVLAESHPRTMDALVRLASQGRSLGVHLIVATQRPSGAVTSAMRANMEARLALRCVDEADSMDILGTSQAAHLPRIPGRAVLRDRGVFQVAWIEDLTGVLDAVARRWGSVETRVGLPSASTHLWADDLPADLDWAQVDGVTAMADAHRASSAVALGLIDGIDRGHHFPLMWTGGSVRVEGPHHVAAALGRTGLAIGIRLSQELQLPLHVCSYRPRLAGPWNTWIRPDDAGACAHLLNGVIDHGPAVVIVEDVEMMLSALDTALGPARGAALWTRLLAGAARAGVVVVAATPGQWGGSGAGASAFAWRLVCTTDAQDCAHAGLTSSAPRCRVPGRLVVARAPGVAAGVTSDVPGMAPEMPVCQVPVSPPPAGRTRPPEPRTPEQENRTGRGADRPAPLAAASEAHAGGWQVLSLTDRSGWGPHGPAGPAGTVVLAGDGLDPMAARPDQTWLVIAAHADPVVAAIVRAHREQHAAEPDILVLAPHQWTQIPQWPSRTVLATQPGPDVLRALQQLARGTEPGLAAERFDACSGVVLDRGLLHRMVLRAE